MTSATHIKEITKDELDAMMKTGKPFELLNVLAPAGYSLGVIKGSRKIPLADLPNRIGELSKGKDVVTYCANTGCTASHKAAEMLAGKGFTVAVYKGGAEEWAAAGLPLEFPVGKPEVAGAAEMDDAGCCSDPKAAKK